MVGGSGVLPDGLLGRYQPAARRYIVWLDSLLVALGGFLGAATVWRYAHGEPLFWFGLLYGLTAIVGAARLLQPPATIVQPSGLRVRRDLRWTDLAWTDVLSVAGPQDERQEAAPSVSTRSGQVVLPGFPPARVAELQAYARTAQLHGEALP